MKKKLFALLIFVFTAVALGSVTSRATAFDTIDARTAFGGASLALKRYLESNPDGAQILMDRLSPIKELTDKYRIDNGTDAPEEDKETLYDNRIIGVVNVESSLNVRASSTMLSDIVAHEYRGMEIYVTGERISNSTLWYKVYLNGTEGYIMGKYVVFGDEADAFKQQVHEEYRDNTPLPEEVTWADDIDKLPEDARKKFDEYVAEVNYVLKDAFKNNEEDGSYLGMYTVLIYALENYSYISDLCDQYGLTETSSKIRNQIWTLELNRERLSYESDTSYDEFNKQMEEEAERKAREAREEAERKEREERERAEAAERAYKASMTYQIPNFAAQYLGILPYVWGGSSLQYGADCSGFVSQVYAHFGLIDQWAANTHAYDSTTLRSLGYAVSLENIQPGDMVCYNGHVAIYYGNGVIIHAPSPGKMISFASLYIAPIIAIRRLY